MRHDLTTILVLGVALVAGCATPPRVTDSGAPAAETGGSEVAAGNLGADFARSAGDRVFFAYDQASLSNDAREVLRRQADWMARHPHVRVLVAGNCDERGTREYNLALGARRAAAVRDFLVSLGVSPSRIDTTSYGKDRPIDPRQSEEGWSVNRNAHTQVLSGASS